MRLCVVLLCALGFLADAGCERHVPKEDLGTVIFEVPAVPGSDKPPPMPEMEGAVDAHPPGKRHK
jgi:hypothetical protein